MKAIFIKLTHLFIAFFILLGTSVCVAANRNYPERIVSLGPIYTENIYLLGAGDRLVGNTVYCVRPPEARKKMKVGTVLQASVEKIISLNPDLILATGLTPPKLVEKLQDLGYRVVHFKQPKSFEEICSQFKDLGRSLGLEEKAATIIEEIREEVEEIRRKVAASPKPRVLLQVGATPLFVSGSDSFADDYINLGGGENAIGDDRSGKINFEQVVAADPEVIIIAIMGSQSGVAAQELKNWRRYRTMRAVRSERIHIIDPNIACSPSPATFLQALKIIAHYLHPNSF